MAKVFLDAGHGGKDPGAVGNGIREKDITLAITLRIGEILKKHKVGVVYSRTTDVFFELHERANKANKGNADIFVSIHCNSAVNNAARGVETYHYANSSQGARLARAIQTSIVTSNTFSQNRGVKTANFVVLRQTKMPAALIELGFISNSQDAQILRTKQNEIAEAVARGILSYLGIKYKEDESMTDKDKPSNRAKEAWEWAIEKGITDGTRPKEPATREEIITMLNRFYK